MNVAVCEGLREIFKKEWDKHYGTTKGVWDDTIKSGNELYNMEGTRRHAKPYLNFYQCGKRSKWDCTALFDAILYSNAIKKRLNPHVTNKVDELRKLRNELTHTFGPQHKISDTEFENAYKKVQKCFKALKLSTANVEKITHSFKRKFVTSPQKLACICFIVFVAGLFSCVLYYSFSNPITGKVTLFHFRVLPTRPVHLVANRSRTVNAILEELHNLSIKNNRSLTYLYISGNPGSGKSQLARLVGQRYGTTFSRNWSADGSAFVMTLKGTSLPDILWSYNDFASRLDCNADNIAKIINSNETETMVKIQILKTEIAKRLQEFRNSWLLIVDNVVKMSETIPLLPQLEDEDWQGGQVLITTQDMSSIPLNSSMTVHISVSKGMDPEESCEFLTDLSGLFGNQNMVSKVAKELDYQPLALASAAFYIKLLRESKASSHFTWKDYLTKLDQGKRNLTEMKLTKVNQAYTSTMSTAVLLAVKSFAERDLVIKHAFRFFSYVSHETQSLQSVVNYVLKVDKEKDKEDTSLKISQCSLILYSDELKVPSISLHRVVHDHIKLYIAHDAKPSTKSREPLFVLQSLLQEKCYLKEIALVPHLKAFSASTKNLSLEVIIPRSKKHKQNMQIQIFDLTFALITHGELLLSRNYLILALKLATNSASNSKFNHEDTLYLTFPKIGEIYGNLGYIEQTLGDSKKARKHLKKALKIFSRQYGSSHKSVAKCLVNLVSYICSNPKECDENVIYAKQLLNIDGSLETKAILFCSQGALHYRLNDLQQALQYYLHANKIFEELRISDNFTNLKENSRWLAQIRSYLGAIYYRLANFQQAKVLINLSIDMYREITGPNHLGIADSYSYLGLTHFKLNDLQSAEDCYKRALEIYHLQLESTHPKIAQVSQNLAAVFEKTGQLSKAKKLDEQYGTCRRHE